jgi:hypothetical protein
MLTDDSLGVIPGRPKGEPGIPRHHLEIPDSPLPRRSRMTGMKRRSHNTTVSLTMPDHRPLLFCCQEDLQAGRLLGRLTRSARFGSAQAIICGGEPMQLQLWKDFLPAIAPTRRCWTGPWPIYKWRDDRIVPVICPTCQMFSNGSVKAILAGDPRLLCMGLFSIF